MQSKLYDTSAPESAIAEIWTESVRIPASSAVHADKAAHNGTILNEFIRISAVVTTAHTCEQVVKLFEKYPDSECIVVCGEENDPVGLVMRDRFFRHLSRRYGADLFYERSIASLMDPAPLLIELSVSPQELLDQALKRSEKTLYDCVIVTDRQSFAGILTVADLLEMSRLLQKQAVRSQARALRNAGLMMKEIDSAVSDVQASTKNGEALSALMVDLTLKGKNELDSVSRAFTALLERTALQERQISELQRHADTIGKVSSLIRELAERSNLLALNATIEAARAGEHGKGFGVVAHEVRQMASETKRSAGEISEMILDMLEAVDRTTSLVRTGREEAAVSESSVRRASQAFEELFHAAANNRGSAQEIDELASKAHERSSTVSGEMRKLLEELQQGE